MRFASENIYIYLAPLCFGAILYYGYRLASHRRHILRSSSDSLLAITRHNLINSFLLLIGGIFISLALLRPQGDLIQSVGNALGADIVVAIDVSESMLATDLKPTRLERARREVLDLLDLLHGERVGVVTFAGTAFVEIPLTLDYSTVRSFLESLGPKLIPVGGSNLSSAIDLSLVALGKSGALPTANRAGAIFMITDGEELQGSAISAAERAKSKDVPIYVLGVGTPEGAPIPSGGGTARGGFKRDSDGKMVISKLAPDVLGRLAELSGGRFAISEGGSSDLDYIYQQGFYQRVRLGQSQGVVEQYEEFFQIFLGLAIILLILSQTRYVKSFASLLLVFLCVPGIASSQDLKNSAENARKLLLKGEVKRSTAEFEKLADSSPEDPAILTGLGASQYRNGKYKEAAESFDKAAQFAVSPKQRAEARYNQGNALAKLGDYKKAIEVYDESLKTLPQDHEAIDNRTLVKKLIKEQQQQKQEQEQEQQNQPQNSGDQRDSSDKQQQNSQDDKQDSTDKNQDQQEERNKSAKSDGGDEKKQPENGATEKEFKGLLDNLEESRHPLENFRRREAIKQLKAQGVDEIPSEDW